MSISLLEQPQSAADDAGSGPTILIIDDDDALVDTLSHRLSRQGFTTMTADSGEAGLLLARSERPAAIVLDLRLPDVDGLTICQNLADSSETCDIPIIVLSGMERPDIVRRCRAAGCHYFIRKPYDPNVLLMLIRQAIEESGRWTGLAS